MLRCGRWKSFRARSLLHGEIPKSLTMQMNGLTLFADLMHGQKTGVFLDQRENYVAAASYARGQALDCFTSTGGFALHLAAKCDSVEAIDSSEAALDTARRNAQVNGIANIDFREADTFDVLAGHASARRLFDTIVLDPPAFAKSRAHLDAALRAYREINQRGMRLLKPGGVLITCSCSQHVSEADLLQVLAQSALDAKKTRAHSGAAYAGARPSHPADGARDDVPEVPDRRVLVVSER